MTNVLACAGCRPEPLGSYLKALGVLRAVARQADPAATGHWDGSVFVLTTSLDRDELVAFFLHEWCPTPILSPWNKDSKISATSLGGAAATIDASSDRRLDAYRTAIRVAQSVLAKASQLELLIQSRGTQVDLKWIQLSLLRNCLPEEAILWIDAVAAIQDRLNYSPLFRSSGVDGRDEISSRYMKCVVEILGTSGRGRRTTAKAVKRVTAWLEEALFEEPADLKAGPVGMLFPGQADVKSSPIGDQSVINPWDYVLALEGTLLFASALARRASASQARATFPFMFRPGTVANSAATEGEIAKKADGELWAPLWRCPAKLPEVQRLVAEGRIEWNQQQAQDPVDAVRAVGALGVDRGIASFSRHLIVQRRGQNRLVQAVGRVEVRERPQVMVLAQLDGWVAQLREVDSPAVRQALGAYERAAWAAATRDRPEAYLGVLAAVAACEAAAGVSANVRAKERAKERLKQERLKVRPIDVLLADRWWPVVDDGSAEVRMAAALASARDDDGTSLRTLLRPQGRDRGRRLVWREGGAPVEGFGRRPLTEVLADALVARTVAKLAAGDRATEPVGGRDGASGPGRAEGDEAARGVQPAFERWSVQATFGDVAQFLAGEFDMGRLGTALAALLVLEGWRRVRPNPTQTVSQPVGYATDALPPPGFALLAPFFFPSPLKLRGGGTVELRPQAHWPHLLRVGRLDAVLREALIRLRMARREPLVGAGRDDVRGLAAGLDGPSVAAALLVPIGAAGAARLLEWVTEGTTDDVAGGARPTTTTEEDDHASQVD